MPQRIDPAQPSQALVNHFLLQNPLITVSTVLCWSKNSSAGSSNPHLLSRESKPLHPANFTTGPANLSTMTLSSALRYKFLVMFTLLLSITVVTAHPVTIGQFTMRVEVKYLEGTISISKTLDEHTQVETTNAALEKFCTLLVGLLDHRGGVNQVVIGNTTGTVAQDGKEQDFEITIGSFLNSRSYRGQVTWTGTKEDNNLVVSGILNHMEGNKDLVATVENGYIVKVCSLF
ncbi:hypothetical protein EV368DRAFT_85795 [Lentinula lateritia]|nr:hypothetical protein EV368DRAFT_85795 [Lentinula lateritia]